MLPMHLLISICIITKLCVWEREHIESKMVQAIYIYFPLRTHDLIRWQIFAVQFKLSITGAHKRWQHHIHTHSLDSCSGTSCGCWICIDAHCLPHHKNEKKSNPMANLRKDKTVNICFLLSTISKTCLEHITALMSKP